MTHSVSLLSRDGRETAVLAAFASPTEGSTAVSRVRAALSKPPLSGRSSRGCRVRFGGAALITQEINERTRSDLARAELLAFPILLLLSFWFFRGLVAALLPLLVGGFAIVLTFMALRLIDQFTPISVFALNLVSGAGLGLGIDYSLFVLYRYREELASGASSAARRSERTLRTAGRTVLFSCVTVAAALSEPARVPDPVSVLDGYRRGDRGALWRRGRAARVTRRADRAGASDQRAHAGMAAAARGARRKGDRETAAGGG